MWLLKFVTFDNVAIFLDFINYSEDYWILPTSKSSNFLNNLVI